MNAELDKAVALFAEEKHIPEVVLHKRQVVQSNPKDMHWQWRLRSVETLAAYLDPDRFGVKGFYVFGSVKNATAGPQSDIDILIHFYGSDHQRKDLSIWLDGWSQSLGLRNYDRTGYKIDGLLDVHMVTDEDIKNRTSYALKIDAKTDPARPLAVGGAVKKNDQKA